MTATPTSTRRRAVDGVGGRPRTDPDVEHPITWTRPAHLSDGVHLECPGRNRPIRLAPDAVTTCPVHGTVVPQLVPLVPWADATGDHRLCARCGCSEVSRPKGEPWLCEDCLDVADRNWARTMLQPRSVTTWGAPGRTVTQWWT